MQDLKPSADNNRQTYLTQDNGKSDNNRSWDYIKILNYIKITMSAENVTTYGNVADRHYQDLEARIHFSRPPYTSEYSRYGNVNNVILFYSLVLLIVYPV